MALTQTDLDNLEKALANGYLTVEYEGRRVTYRSTTELLQAIDYTRAKLEAGAANAQPRTSVIEHRRD